MLHKGNNTESNPVTTEATFFYGWVVAIAGAIALMVTGNFQYSFGVFVKPLVDKFGWSRAAISVSVSARYISTGLVSPIAGALSDRYKPRIFILTGIFIVALGYVLSSRITSLWQLYLFLGAFTGIGLAAFYVPMVTIVTRWFGAKAALANGIVMSGFGMAQAITPPAATYLILHYSLETSFIILGIATLVIGTGAWFFIKTSPDIANQTEAEPTDSETPAKAENNYTLSEALYTRALWLVLLVYMVVAVCYQMVAIHVIAAATDKGITPETAAIIITISGITNTLGRLTLGGLARKFGNKTVFTIGLAIQALSLFFLANASDLLTFYIIAAVYGLAYGGITPIIPTLAASFFGTRSMGSIFGSITTAYTVGAAVGPFLAGYTFDVTGSYYIAFLSAAITMTIVFLLSLMLKPPRRKILAT